MNISKITVKNGPLATESAKDAAMANSFRPKSILLHRMKPYWPVLVLATIMTVLLSLVGAVIGTVIGPSFKILLSSNPEEVFFVKDLLGSSLGNQVSSFFGIYELTSRQLMDHLPLVLISLAGMKAVFFLGQTYIFELTGEKVSRRLRSELFSGYLHINPEIGQTEEGKKYESELSSGMSVDIKFLKEYTVRFYGGMPRELLQAIFLGVTLYLLSSRLFFVFFLGLLPVVVVIRRLGKVIRKRSGKALEDFSTLTEWLQQRLLGVETIKHYGTEAIEVKKLEELTSNLFHRFYKSARAKAKSSPIIEAASAIAVGFVIYISLSDVEKGVVTGAVVMSFLTTLALMSQSINRFGRYYNNNREASAAVSRISNILKFSHEQKLNSISHQEKIKDDSGSKNNPVLIADDVSVRYDERDVVGLDRFSFEFFAGKIYCVCGHSGAGKSTLVSILLGVLKPNSGKIRFAGNDFQENVSYVPQEIALLPGTFAENIAYPEESNFNKSKIENALEEVGLTDFVSNLDDGIDTLIGHDGIGLSGGQSQRLMLARLWYGKKKLIVIDEGTSALDPQNEQHIYNALKKLASKGSAVIMIAHRLSAMEFADEVILLKCGKIVDSGPYQSIKPNKEFMHYLGGS